jgi:hypothetical protein
MQGAGHINKAVHTKTRHQRHSASLDVAGWLLQYMRPARLNRKSDTPRRLRHKYDRISPGGFASLASKI